jgi:phosphate transport system permease protein
MSNLSLIALLLALMAIGYQLGMVRSRRVATLQTMHSRPHHYGMMVGLWAFIPAFFILLLWSLLAPGVISSMVSAQLPADALAAEGMSADVIMRRISNQQCGDAHRFAGVYCCSRPVF